MRSSFRGRAKAALLTVAALVAGLLLVAPSTASAAATSLPCDIYAAAGTPCVAAHSTVRALYAAYDGPLYRVRRASDGTSLDIGVNSAGGYADSDAQDVFCAETACTITEIYDQSSNHNNLTIEGGGGANGNADVAADASALPIVVNGNKVYGVYVGPGVGYRDDSTAGIPTGDQAQGEYMVASGTHVNSGCCFDYGNAETNNDDNGNGHMEAVNLGTSCWASPCSGSGPWVAADLENGLFQGSGSNTADAGNASAFVTALLKSNNQTTFALKGANAQSGSLSTWYSGALPSNGYQPMHLEGAIVLGTGGDNSNASIGSFFEGVMTSGEPTDAADNAVQANVVAAGYSGNSGGSPSGGTITLVGGQCVDVAGDDVGGDLTYVQVWSCQSSAIDQHWTHNSDGSLETLGRCLDIDGDGTAAGTKVELWDCNGVGGQKWIQQSNGSLLNPQSGLCLDDPSGNTANGTQLQIWTCNGATAQEFSVNGGGPIDGPGSQCVDVAGDDVGTDYAIVQLWDCQPYSADQHWYHNSNGSLETLGRCLDIDGDGTAVGTKVELWDCNGVGGQVWQQQSNGSLLNPQSGLCLDDPSDNTANGTQLQIYTCNGTAAQKFALT
ncbi:ricin-type beta-trefoil lectin domain protein [Actinospica durhamensis]|uniref:Ricin-type beta-trefoil lectin domain protein n=1 Tax=Actinospica durhamensis TaxID=1508375 RepID=A0A941ITF5_9ACTN|nr:arabinofuranosidase catalytic domain-containing protein [Actinospica durhamensis]MBR7837567.1 ricin-type beta-trefoil lectin domain protein [Actinospica durhamensis]